MIKCPECGGTLFERDDIGEVTCLLCGRVLAPVLADDLALTPILGIARPSLSVHSTVTPGRQRHSVKVLYG